MAVLNPPIPDSEFEGTALKVNSVKQLPQSQLVPTMYEREFFAKEFRDSHIVIQSIRADLVGVLEILKDPVNVQLTNHNAVLSEILDRLTIIDSQISNIQNTLGDHAQRIFALENP